MKVGKRERDTERLKKEKLRQYRAEGKKRKES
jgi:hypothetical protein